jgi:hypothetical protein
MMYWPKHARPEVEATWLEVREQPPYRGDGELLDSLWRTRAYFWQDLVPGHVLSYKVHIQKARRIPTNVSVICFHGRPRPWATALWGPNP